MFLEVLQLIWTPPPILNLLYASSRGDIQPPTRNHQQDLNPVQVPGVPWDTELDLDE